MRATEPVEAASGKVHSGGMSDALTARWAQEIKDWRVAMSSMRLSPETIALRTFHVNRLGRTYASRDPWDLKIDDLLEWTGRHEWSRETARAVRSSLRRFWRWGVETGRTGQNVADTLPPIAAAQPRPRPAAAAVVLSALQAAEPRVALMIRLANDLGMRRAEVSRVEPSNDLVRGPRGWSLIVHGKGARNRVLPIPDDLAGVLGNVRSGYLFPNPCGGHLSPHWVGTLVSRALPSGTTMHQLRHLCATELHEATHDIRLVQTVLGHASLATTERYVAVDSVRVRDAISERSRAWANPGAS